MTTWTWLSPTASSTSPPTSPGDPEAFRVLEPGGRFAVSDMVFLGDKDKLPLELVRSMEARSGCVSGALKDEYEKLLGKRASKISPSKSPTPTNRSSPLQPGAAATPC